MIYTAANIENEECIFRYRVYNRKGKTFKTYIARITGEDPNYILKRDFMFRYICHYSRFDTFTYILEDGIYEWMVKRFDNDTGASVEKERKWLVVSDGEMTLYDDDDMNYQYVLYTAFNLQLCGETA